MFNETDVWRRGEGRVEVSHWPTYDTFHWLQEMAHNRLGLKLVTS